MAYSGSFVAIITPFDRKGRLDRKALAKLVEWHVSEGTDGIVCGATTGEGPCLNSAEKKAVAEICIKTAAGRIPIIVGTGTNDTRASVLATEKALKWGANGCLAVTPYYNKPSQRGCLLHFTEIAKVGLPVTVYHNPPRCVIRLTAETVIEMSQIPNIVGFKDSGRDLELVRKICKWIPVYSGDDDITLDIIRNGGKGTIGVIGNVIPRGWKQMVHFALEGEWEKAEFLYQKYLPLCKSLFFETNPQPVKFALSWLNRCKPVLRLPMTLPTEATQLEVKKELTCLALSPFVKADSLPRAS